MLKATCKSQFSTGGLFAWHSKKDLPINKKSRPGEAALEPVNTDVSVIGVTGFEPATSCSQSNSAL